MGQTKRDDGGQAFPTHAHPDSFDGAGMSGMSLRDYFAAQAVVGVTLHDKAYDWAPNAIARRAYDIADAMLAAQVSS